MTGDKLIVFCTAGDSEEGYTIAKTLVKKKLAACVNIVPGVRSVYRYKGKIEEDTEVLLLIKTSVSLLETLKVWIKQLHSYDVPEIVAINPDDMSGTFEAWWDDQLVDPSDVDIISDI